MTFPLTKDQFLSAVTQLRERGLVIRDYKGKLDYMGVELNYEYSAKAETLSIHIGKRPMFVTENAVAVALRNLFNGLVEKEAAQAPAPPTGQQQQT